MNYLAHFHLAARLASERGEEGDGLLIGALLGDYVKGPLRGDYPDDWEEGIRLHRRTYRQSPHYQRLPARLSQ